MLRKVKITKLPQAKTGYQVKGSLYNDVPSMGGGADYNAYMGKPKLQTGKYITAVPREEANLEAEGGETVYGDINGDGMPEHKIIKGPRHTNGGVPLKLPDDTFIFSDTKSMIIKDCNILKMFNKPCSGKGFTPAELAKQFDIGKYRKILQDPDSDALDRKTAEIMLKNYAIKLGALALAQESKKGFPQGIPEVAKPYMEAMGLRPEDVLPEKQITDTIDQLDQQTNNQRSAATMGSPTEEQDEAAGMTPDETQMQFGGMMSQNKSFAFQQGGWLPEEIAVFTGQVPQAEYGMAMGANPQNYEGRTKDLRGAERFFENGGYLPKAQNGIEIDITGMTKDQKDRAFHNARLNANGQTIYAVENGKRVGQINYKRLTAEELTDVEGVDMTSFGDPKNANSVAAAAQYKLLENSLKDPDIAAKLCEETTASLKNAKSYVSSKGAQGKTWEQRNLALPTCDQIKTQFLLHQKRNLSFQGQQVDPKLFTDSGRGLASLAEIVARKARHPETGKLITNTTEAESARQFLAKKYGTAGAKDVSVNQISDKIGVPLGNTATDRALQQASFHGYTHMVDNMSTYDPELQYKARNFVGNIQRGEGDEKGMEGLFKNIKSVQISPIDDFNANPVLSSSGNSTMGQIAGSGLDTYDLKDIAEDKDKVIKKCPCQKSDGTIIDVGQNPNTGVCNPCIEDKNYDVDTPAQWWLQDTINTVGAVGDRSRLNKYMDWAPRVDYETPRATFEDYTGAVATIAGAGNIATQGINAFSSAQGASSRTSSVQGDIAAQTVAQQTRTNNANVNRASQFEMNNAHIRNQEAGANQAINAGVYRSNSTANQQFDNADLALRTKGRGLYTNAITNRAKTDTVNKLYPQFAVTPGNGGFLGYKGGRKFTGEGSGSQKSYDDWLSYYEGKGQSSEVASTNAKNAFNSQKGDVVDDDKASIIRNIYGKAKGGQMKQGGFIYGDITYPFIM